MIKFKGFTPNDFNYFVLKDKKLLKTIKYKFKRLLIILSGEIGGYSEIYEYKKGRFAGYLSESKNRKSSAILNIQLNADDLSLEFQIENRDLLFNFLKKVDVKTLNNLRKIGDCEIAAWDSNKKVCKLYPGSLGKPDINFLISKLRLTRHPIFKFRKIYHRDDAKELLQSPRLMRDLLDSIRTMEVLYKFT